MTHLLALIQKRCKLLETIIIFRLTGTEEQIGGFDLICRGNPVKLPQNSTYMSHLGCHNNRQQQLKKLAKSTAARLVQHYAQEQLVNQNNNTNATGQNAGGQGAGTAQGTSGAAGAGQGAGIQKENTITANK